MAYLDLLKGQVWKILDESLASRQEIEVLKSIRKSPDISTSA